MVYEKQTKKRQQDKEQLDKKVNETTKNENKKNIRLIDNDNNWVKFVLNYVNVAKKGKETLGNLLKKKYKQGQHFSTQTKRWKKN